MINRSVIKNIPILFSFLILYSFFSTNLPIPVEASPSGNDARILEIQDSPYKSYLPIIQKPYPIFISPGIYTVNKCVESSVYAQSTGDYIGELTECVPSIEVRLNGTMQFNFTWTLDFIEGLPPIRKYNDADNPNMYVTDNVDNHYDHIEVGGDAANDIFIEDAIPVEGWFLFLPAKQNATMFSFHDDDQGVSIDNIDLSSGITLQ